jgi:hypothetical protein
LDTPYTIDLINILLPRCKISLKTAIQKIFDWANFNIRSMEEQETMVLG